MPTGQLDELHTSTQQQRTYASRAAGADVGGGSLAAKLRQAADSASPLPQSANRAQRFGSSSPPLATPQPAGLAAAAAESEAGTLQDIEDRFYQALALRLGARP